MLRTTLFFIGWACGTLAMGIGGMAVMLMPQRFVWRYNSAWAGFTLWWLRLTCRIHPQVEGIPASQLIAAKHQSTLDTLLLWRQFGNPVFVLKRELYLIPIFGWFLWRSGQIAIDRSKGRSAFEQIGQQAPKLLAQGRTLILFPEGTRVRVGDHKPYRSGIARISALLGLAVTPVALNHGLYWPKHTLRKRPGAPMMRFLPPLPACSGNTGKWMARLEQLISAESQRLVETAEK